MASRNESYKRIGKYAQHHVSNKLRVGEGSNQKGRPNWLMIILHYIIQALTAVLSALVKRKNRLNP